MNNEVKTKLINALAALELASDDLSSVLDELTKEGLIDSTEACVVKVDLRSIKLKFINWLRQMEESMPLKRIIEKHDDDNLIIRFLKDKGLTENKVRVIKLSEIRDYAKDVLGIEDPDKQIIDSLNEIRFHRTNYLVKPTTHDFFTIGSYITNGKWEYIIDNVEFIFLNKDVEKQVVIYTNDPGWIIGRKGDHIKEIARYFNKKLDKKLKYIVKEESREQE